jgi:AcrR family transcriptional regulator
MIIDAAVEVVRRSGFESVNARTVSSALRCSTQPVMYHFSTIENLKRAAYRRADSLHTQYLMNARPGEDPILGIGLNYVRFAVEEPQLFRFLFQSGYVAERSLRELIASEALTPITASLQAELGLEPDKAREMFLTLALFTHGYASILANNDLDYDEKQAAAWLERAFIGAAAAARNTEDMK